MINSRMLCLECLIDINENKKHSHLVINETLDTYQYLEKQERAFITRVAEGTIQTAIELDYVIDQYSKVKVKKMKPVILFHNSLQTQWVYWKEKKSLIK